LLAARPVTGFCGGSISKVAISGKCSKGFLSGERTLSRGRHGPAAIASTVAGNLNRERLILVEENAERARPRRMPAIERKAAGTALPRGVAPSFPSLLHHSFIIARTTRPFSNVTFRNAASELSTIRAREGDWPKGARRELGLASRHGNTNLNKRGGGTLTSAVNRCKNERQSARGIPCRGTELLH